MHQESVGSKGLAKLPNTRKGGKTRQRGTAGQERLKAKPIPSELLEKKGKD